MFDIGWSELLLIGVVAIIVVAPKELPGFMRAFGEWISKIRRMAADFQSQFHEAMREAEMADLKKAVDEMAGDQLSNFDPLDVYAGPIEETVGMGRDILRPTTDGKARCAAAPAARPLVERSRVVARRASLPPHASRGRRSRETATAPRSRAPADPRGARNHGPNPAGPKGARKTPMRTSSRPRRR